MNAPTIRPIGDTLRDHRTEWVELADHLGVNLSLYPMWVETAAGSLGLPGTLSTAVLRGDRGLLALAPVRLTRERVLGVPLAIAEIGAGLVNYHFEILARDRDPELLAALLDAVLGALPCHLVRVNGVVAGSATATALDEFARRNRCEVLRYEGEASPYLPVAGQWKAFLAGRSKKFRYKFQRRAASIAELEGAELRWYFTPESVPELQAAIFAIEPRSWKQALGKAITSSESERRYHEALLPALARHGVLEANVLHIRGNPVAYNLGCRSRGWVGHLKTSFDTAYSQYSPGAVVIDSAIQRAFEQGASEFDFLGDADPHKLTWTDNVRRHQHYFIFTRRFPAPLVAWVKQRAKRWRPSAAPAAEAPAQ